MRKGHFDAFAVEGGFNSLSQLSRRFPLFQRPRLGDDAQGDLGVAEVFNAQDLRRLQNTRTEVWILAEFLPHAIYLWVPSSNRRRPLSDPLRGLTPVEIEIIAQEFYEDRSIFGNREEFREGRATRQGGYTLRRKNTGTDRVDPGAKGIPQSRRV